MGRRTKRETAQAWLVNPQGQRVYVTIYACAYCTLLKPTWDYYPHRRKRADGTVVMYETPRWRCKACETLRLRQRYKASKQDERLREQYRAIQKRYYERKKLDAAWRKRRAHRNVLWRKQHNSIEEIDRRNAMARKRRFLKVRKKIS